MKNKKARGGLIIFTVICLILLILVTSLLLFSLGFFKNEKNLEPFQSILNNYSKCVINNDTACECNYLIEYHCNNLIKYNISPKREEALFAELLNVKITNRSTIKGLDPTRYNQTAQLPFIAKTGELKDNCFQAAFVKEDNDWKIFDIEGPAPMNYCK